MHGRAQATVKIADTGGTIRGLPLWTGPVLLIAAGAATQGLAWILTRNGPPFLPRNVGHVGDCTATGLQDAALPAFSAHLRWLSMFSFLSVAALIATGAAVATFALSAEQARRFAPSQRHAVGFCLAIIVAVGALAVGAQLRWPKSANGILTLLIDTLPGDKGCDQVRALVFKPKIPGEGAGVVVAVGMCALLVIPALDKTRMQQAIAARLRWLQMLLYAGATLFVAGVLCTEANLGWILSHWVLAPKTAKEVAASLDKVVKAGAMISGVAYSSALVIFYLPARLLLGIVATRLAESHVDTQPERQKWLTDNDLGSSWRDSAMQLIALLAPVFSGTLFDVLAKLR